MDRLINAAWRVFWVALGASAVLVAQTLLAQLAPAPEPVPPAALEAPRPGLMPAAAVDSRSHQLLSALQGCEIRSNQLRCS
jgi:hypothetical protein